MKDSRDIQRGTGNRVADGASLLGEGNNGADHSHVKRTTALRNKDAPNENRERTRNRSATGEEHESQTRQ